MRIVYDDTMQGVVFELVEEYMSFLNRNIKRVVKYDWGMDRVQRSEVKERLSGYLEDHYMEIGNTVTHAHGIGNNCQYPVYYYNYDNNEMQHCANININSGMYGEVYVSLENYNGKRIGGIFYELTRNGVTRKYFK